MSENLSQLYALGAELRRYSDVFKHATVEYPGTVQITTDHGGYWVCGTVNGHWGADLYLNDQSQVDGDAPDVCVDTAILPDEVDVPTIAEALFAAMCAFDGTSAVRTPVQDAMVRDLFSRAHAVLREDDHADENHDLIRAMRAALGEKA